MNYTLRDIDARRKELIAERDAVLAVLDTVEFPGTYVGGVAAQLREKVYQLYYPELDWLDSVAEVSAWWWGQVQTLIKARSAPQPELRSAPMDTTQRS
jgi:hypothetical protein